MTAIQNQSMITILHSKVALEWHSLRRRNTVRNVSSNSSHYGVKGKLNPLRAMWPMEPVLISGFCSVKRMRVFDSPWTEH